jgi:hypothetical protein
MFAIEILRKHSNTTLFGVIEMSFKKLLFSLAMTMVITPAFANDANQAFDHAISKLDTAQVAEFLRGASADQIQLPDGTSLTDSVKSALSPTGPLEFRAMPPCPLQQAFLPSSVLAPFAVRGFCNVPADARAIALSIYAIPTISRERPSSITIGAFPGDEVTGLSNAGAVLRIPYSQDAAQAMTIVRLCETCSSSDFILRASFSTTVEVGVLGYFVPALPGAVGPQGIQGIPGATGPRGPQGVAVTAAANCGLGDGTTGSASLACASICGGSNRVLSSSSTNNTAVPCTISAVGGASCQQLASATRMGFCCACSAPLAP